MRSLILIIAVLCLGIVTAEAHVYKSKTVVRSVAPVQVQSVPRAAVRQKAKAASKARHACGCSKGCPGNCGCGCE